MNSKHEEQRLTEQALREAYLGQPGVSPREAWMASVMEQVRREPMPARALAPAIVSVAWRAGWVAALAASLFAILSFRAMPSQEKLTWDLYKGGVASQWSVTMGE